MVMHPKLDFRDLALACAIVDEGSMTAAAARLHLTQSALSHRLRALEAAYGGTLFERHGRGMTATAMGSRLVETARRVLADVAAAEADLEALASGRAGVVRLAVECYTAYHWLPPVLTPFRERRPDVEVRVVAEATEEPLPWILDGRLEIAIVTKVSGYAREVDAGALRLTPLFEDEMVAVVPKGHPWAARASIAADDIAAEHLVLYQRYDPRRRPARPLPLPAGAVPAGLTTVPATTEGVVALVRAGVGATVMARWAAGGYLGGDDLAAVPFEGDGVWRVWYAATRAECEPAVEALVGGLAGFGPQGTARGPGGDRQARRPPRGRDVDFAADGGSALPTPAQSTSPVP